MSGIAGIFRLDGGPVDLLALHRLGEALAWRGPDGVNYWHVGSLGFVHAQFCTTPESLQEKQPLRSRDARLCLTFDGRIDNRDELIPALKSHGVDLFDTTDPGLLLAAYQLWETGCLQHIVGDFAFALWDQAKRQLWCARDHIGIRPFYYVHTLGIFLFASDIQSLLTHPAVSLAINEGMVAEYLARAITSRDETLYRDIQRLPSATTLTLTSDGECRLTPWWTPEFSLIQYSTDAEYAEHFTHVMEQSVAARMRAHGGWACQLSGGLDSSTIAVTAQTLLDRSGSGERVRTFSTVAPGKPWDESEYIAETARLWNFESYCQPPVYLSLDLHRREAERSREFPGYPNSAPLFAGVYQAAKVKGLRVLLAGHGGNHLLEGNFSHLADLASQGSLFQLARVGREDWRIYGTPGRWPVFIIRKLLLQSVPQWVRAWRKRNRLDCTTCLSRNFIRRTHLAERIETPPRQEIRNFTSLAQRSVFHMLQDGEMVRAQELIDRVSHVYGIEERHPFLDRRLVEFGLRIPEHQRQRGISWKWILKTSMNGRLPQRVLQRTQQAEFSEFYCNALSETDTRNTLQSLTIASKTDWLDPARLSEVVHRQPNLNSGESSQSTLIWMLIGTELWFQTLHGLIANDRGAVPNP